MPEMEHRRLDGCFVVHQSWCKKRWLAHCKVNTRKKLDSSALCLAA